MESDEIKKACAALELLYSAKDHQALLDASKNQNLNPWVRSYANGLLLRPWLPWGLARKLIMFLLTIVIILLALLFQNLSLLFALVVPLFFSPRVAGEASVFLGKLSRD